MAETRTPRDLSSREKNARHVYTPPSLLPEHTPEPGMVFRWIATHIAGVADPANVSRRMREGWEPVKAADDPKLMMFVNEKNGNVETGGLMLCKMPEELARSRDEYYARQNQAQVESVDNHYMRNNDPRMPLFSEKKSTVERGFGSGSK